MHVANLGGTVTALDTVLPVLRCPVCGAALVRDDTADWLHDAEDAIADAEALQLDATAAVRARVTEGGKL